MICFSKVSGFEIRGRTEGAGLIVHISIIAAYYSLIPVLCQKSRLLTTCLRFAANGVRYECIHYAFDKIIQ